MVGKISRSPRYVIDIIGMDLLYLGELGGAGLILQNEVFLTYDGVIRY